MKRASFHDAEAAQNFVDACCKRFVLKTQTTIVTRGIAWGNRQLSVAV